MQDHNININMKYDKIVDSLLREAYFSSPHEKATGIKRHITFANEAEKVSQDNKSDVVNFAIEYVRGNLQDIQDQEGSITRQEFIDLVISGAMRANFDDEMYQSNDHTMPGFAEPRAPGESLTLADFKNLYLGTLSLDTEFKFLTSERIRHIIKKIVAEVERRMAEKGPDAEADAHEIEAVTTISPEDEPNAPIQLTDYAKELLARKGL